MNAFAALFERLDATTSTNAKVDALAAYFRDTSPADAAWGLWLLSGQRFKRIASSQRLRQWAEASREIDGWLFDECYSAVGDVSETVSLLGTGDGSLNAMPLSELVRTRVAPLAALDEPRQQEAVLDSWSKLSGTALFLFNKMLTGGLRVGVSRTLTVRALARASGQSQAHLAHMLTGDWQPDADHYQALFSGQLDVGSAANAKPYPFCLAHPLERSPESLGDVEDWQVEWKWDGIRGQLIRRAGEVHLWSRGEEPIAERFPEIVEAAGMLPDGTVLDGEVLAWKDGDRPLPFARLQQRIGRKRLSAKVLADAPAVFVAYDVLESNAADYRAEPLSVRRRALDALLNAGDCRLRSSPLVEAEDWQALETLRHESRARGVEGFMLKRRDSAYAAGRRKGHWWKWKVEPFNVDAVMIYAQAGHGRRATLHTDYTFAVWRDCDLVPVAKAYSGLSDEEIAELDRWIRANTLERFGPVRSVSPEQVFELSFEAIARSSRHKSGVALRFPRIARWRRDKSAADADRLSTLEALIDDGGG